MVELCQFAGGCFGCCGHDFKGKNAVLTAIKKNTNEYATHDDNVSFRDRAEPYDLRAGLCRNLGILQGQKMGCLIYPKKRKEKDVRIGHCNHDFQCPTLKEFNLWDTKIQTRFLQFIADKNLDWYDHSILLDNGELLREFKVERLHL